MMQVATFFHLNGVRNELFQRMGVPEEGSFDARFLQPNWKSVEEHLKTYPKDASFTFVRHASTNTSSTMTTAQQPQQQQGHDREEVRKISALFFALSIQSDQNGSVPVHVLRALIRANPIALTYQHVELVTMQNPDLSNEIMNVLIDAFERVGNFNTRLFLYRALDNENIAAVKAILRRHPTVLMERTVGLVTRPQSIFERSYYGLVEDATPWHYCMTFRPNLIPLLLEQATELNHSDDVSVKHSFGGLFSLSGDGTTPFDLCIERFQNNPRDVQSHELLFSCLDFVNQEMQEKNNMFHHYSRFHVAYWLFCSGVYIPLQVFRFLLRDAEETASHSDVDGKTVLTKFIEVTTNTVPSEMSRCIPHSYVPTSGDLASIFKLFLSDDGIGKQSAHARDKRGCLPFNIGLMLGLKWEDGLEEILKANFDVLYEQDAVTALPAFLFAASSDCKSQIRTTNLFNILRENPSALVLRQPDS